MSGVHLIKAVDGELPSLAAGHGHAAALSVVAVRAAVRAVVRNPLSRAGQHLPPRCTACHCSGGNSLFVRLGCRRCCPLVTVSVQVCDVQFTKEPYLALAVAAGAAASGTQCWAVRSVGHPRRQTASDFPRQACRHGDNTWR
jgi:hypothetical protein